MIVCLAAWSVAQPAFAAASQGCDAAWSSPAEQRVRLVRLDPTSAALSVGRLVIARAQPGVSPGLLQAMQADRPAAATLQPLDTPRANHWRVAGAVAFDEVCTFELDADVELEAPDPAIARVAEAIATFGRARAAFEGAQLEAAIELADRALAQLGAPGENKALAATIAAFAIERRVDDRQLGGAAQRVQTARTQLATSLNPVQPAALRLELAALRLLPWQDALDARQRLQPTLVATFGANATPTLENRIRLANALVVLGRGDAALAEFDALEVVFAADPNADPALRILLARSHANAFVPSSRHEEQVQRLRALREDLVQRYGAEDRRVVDVEGDLARGLADAARLPEAIRLAARVYLWRERVLGVGHTRTQDSAELLALLFGRAGRHRTARALLEDLLSRLDPTVDSALALRARRDLATWAAIDGEPQAALSLMRRAHDDAQARFSADSIYAQGIAVDYGWLLLRAGQPDAACALFTPLSERVRGPADLREWTDAGLARCLLARRDGKTQDASRAVALLRQANASAEQAVGADNPRALVWQSLLAGAELTAGRRAEARQLLVAFVHRAERNRAAPVGGGAIRDSTFSQWIAENDSMAGYRTLALLHAQDGDLDAAMRVAELARDRQLRDRFAERRWMRLRSDAPEAARLRMLQAQRQRLDAAIAVADITQRVRLEAERVEVADAIDRLEHELAARYPDEASPLTPTVAGVQARLAGDTALVAYQRANDTWWVTVIERGRARLAVIPDSPNLAVAARAWVRSVRGEPVRVWALPDGRWVLAYVRPADAVARVPLAEVAPRLGRALFGSLDLGRQVRRLVVVADDELTGLPLDALAFDAAGTPAVARFEITYAASFGGWLELRDRAAATAWSRDLLAVGAIDTDETATGRGAAAASGVSQGAAWAQLPGARREIERIAADFPRRRVRVLLDRAATKAAIEAANASGELATYRYVHFATHGHVEPAFAERAALVLASADGGEAELTATELAGLSMNAELVVLSACDSGVGRYEQGQGLLGFAFAALAAGNRGAVLSLWPVADESTQMFMAGFYSHLRAGLAPAAALAATKRTFMLSPDPRRNDRRVWSAFVLYGSS